MFDRRLWQHFAPLPLMEARYLERQKLFDENAMMIAMHKNNLRGHVVRDAVVHHYCFNRSKIKMRELHPLQNVHDYILDTKRVDCPARKRLKAA